MRTGQRDVHNTPLKRRLSITYEELETLKKSIKVSVLNELRAEMENVSDQDSIKDLVLSEIRTELMGIPNPALLKASILNELRTELKASGENDSEAADRKLREFSGIQDGLVRELLDQKMLIKKLETQIGDLAKQLEDAKKTAPVAPPSVVPSSVVPSSVVPSSVVPSSVVPSSITLTLPEDPLDLPPLSRKTKPKPELRIEKPAYRLGQFKEAPAPLPGTGAKVQLKLREVEPADLDREEAETKCEYIIAESGDKRGLRGIVRQGSSVREPARQQPSIREPVRQQPPIRTQFRQQPPGSSLPERQPSAVKTEPVEKPADEYKCEYIIAERSSKKHFIEESVDVRENEDAEVITCSRKDSRAK
ncbi:hypothetical protein MSKOL_2834 [Methanosarcina sp. Kolksee]|uniref:hypothetical protein n=1 Tax=Methanosarcina sp. Kolksee TaxID=1434099 RepID=UPI0006155DA4|nr:hypothetical protein [Methanosarcina sp. Kolksee]AKB48611.1 hypothetical protein MSKOL_2834 [Methanosarcina sp. Kolksee]